jgi:hypothetical protein
MELIEIKNMGGIKCDNPLCDYVNKDVHITDYIDYINKPCPCCGENLLTEEDYRSINIFLKTIKFINKIGSFMPKSFQNRMEKRQENAKIVTACWDGTGKVDFNVKDNNSIH